jgi:hypothetical protein
LNESFLAEKLLVNAILSLNIYKHPEDYIYGRDTFYVESFNNVINVYQNKRMAFGDEQYNTRNNLADCPNVHELLQVPLYRSTERTMSSLCHAKFQMKFLSTKFSLLSHNAIRNNSLWIDMSPHSGHIILIQFKFVKKGEYNIFIINKELLKTACLKIGLGV